MVLCLGSPSGRRMFLLLNHKHLLKVQLNILHVTYDSRKPPFVHTIETVISI